MKPVNSNKHIVYTNKNSTIKRILTKRGYAIIKKHYNLKELTEIKSDLMVKPYVNEEYGASPDPYPIYLESEKKIYIPKHIGFEKFGQPDKIKLTKGIEIDVEFKGNLRDKQTPIIQSFMKSCEEGSMKEKSQGGIISVPCGWGKTIMALYLIGKLKRKTIIIVHKEFLLNQWIKRIEEFLPEARVGIIQASKVDYKNKDIVIGMLQTIVSRDYTPDDFLSFGTVIFDECHHLGARVFSQCFNKLISKKMIGLTATVNRKDGLTKVFKYFIGDIMYSMKKKLNTHDVKIEGIHYYSNSEMHKELFNRRGDLNFPGMLNNIVKIPERNNFIVSKIKNYISEGRKIILLSHRINHLKLLKLMIEKENISSVGLYIGGMKMVTLEQSKKADVLLGTYNMVSEGFDDPIRNTLILSTPLSDVVQSAGRILRKQHELQPIILDIIDEFSVFPKQWKKRSTYYKKEKWKFDETEILDGEIINKEFEEQEPITECVL